MCFIGQSARGSRYGGGQVRRPFSTGWASLIAPKGSKANSKEYYMPLNRYYLDGKHIRSQMPEVAGKKRRPGRPRLFDKQAYNHVRSMIERFNGWIKAFRRVATRYERLPQVYMGFVHLACIMVYLRILQ